jgi:hypothetical protein
MTNKPTMQDLSQRMSTISDLIFASNQLLKAYGHKPLKVTVISNKEQATERMQADDRDVINSLNFY